MKINLWNILILFIFFGCNNKKVNKTNSHFHEDQKTNFSYLIGNFDKRTKRYNFNHGTGFFIRKKQRIFFITAYHVVNGWDYETNRPNPLSPDTLNVYFDRNHESSGVQIPISFIKKMTNERQIKNQPDEISFEIINDDTYKVFSIDTILNNKVGVIDSIFFSGFPTNQERFITQFPRTFSMAVDTIYEKPILYEDPTDSFNIWIEITKPIEDRFMYGYSGSVVIAKDKNFELMPLGVLSRLSIINEKKYLVVCKMKYVLAEIESLLAKTGRAL